MQRPWRGAAYWLVPQGPVSLLSFFFSFYYYFFYLLRIFLNDISNAILKVPHTHPPTSLPTHSHFFGPGVLPVLGHIKFVCPMGLSFQ